MSDYTQMAGYYDLIMTSGYYNYPRIVDHLLRFCAARSVLEIGAGTGLILAELADRRPELQIAGVDLTAAMLDLAATRLASRPRIDLHLQNVVTLDLGRSYDLAFSYGGVWYFVPDTDNDKGKEAGGYSLISHLRADRDNRDGLERLATHLPTGASLLLGIQSPHHDYHRPITADLRYEQRITPLENGFRKQYTVTEHDRTVMDQTTDYRTYPFADAIELLDKCGFEFREPATTGRVPSEPAMFLEFGRR